MTEVEGTQKHITLVGAGPAGSMLSIFLAKKGFDVTLYEHRPDMRSANISAGRSINLALANRGIHSLEEVGVMDQVREIMIPMKGRMLHNEAGELQFQPYGQKPEEVIYSISRGDLNKLLMDAAEKTGKVNLQFHKRCEAIDFEKHEITIVDTSKEGKQANQAPFHKVIGADGAGSIVQKEILRANPGDYHQEKLGHSYKELCIPAGKKGTFQMEKNALHIWPRSDFMLIALPNLDGSFTVTLFMANEGKNSFAEINTEEKLMAFFQEYFADTIPLIPDLVQDFFNNPTGRLATIRSNHWSYEGDALVLGDAAHGIVPFHGQGMNAAFESCSLLNQYLEKYGENWEHMFSSFQNTRKPNSDAIADLALENYVEMRKTVRDPKFHLKKQLAFQLEEKYPDIFIPRYSMVMFHRISYAEAKRRGAIQNEILIELTCKIQEIEQVDFKYANQLIQNLLV